LLQKWGGLYDGKNGATAGLLFEMALSQFVDIGYPIAGAIKCIEAAATNPADVYLYWLAILARMKEVLQTSNLPDSVCSEIRGIMNRRWCEFFVEGPTNVHLTAFYLNPSKKL
jgi:hypothetical protein